MTTPRHGRMRNWLRHNVLGVLVLLIVVGGSAMYVQQATRLNNSTECQAEYNRAFALALQQRSDAAAEERSATKQERRANRELISSILANVGDPDARRAALENYVRQSAETDRAADAAEAARLEYPNPTHVCE